MPINSTHTQYNAKQKKWKITRDAIAGEEVLKAGGYIPEFDPPDEKRQEQYVDRAVYLNITGRTQRGLNGAVFRRDPSIELPTQLAYIEEDFDGGGQSLTQLGKETCSDLLAVGRYGLLVDYPSAESGLSKEHVAKLNLKATIATYKAESIIDWRTTKSGGALILTMVRLQEIVMKVKDEFEEVEETQYRVLKLDDGGKYIQQVYNKEGQPVGDEIQPKNSTGERLNYIPFKFVGSEDNRPDCDDPPLYDIAVVNIAHFRNSADHEESLFIHGQGTLFVSSDLSVEDWKKANPDGIVVGARRGHFLGGNGNALLLQVEASGALKIAMDDKEDDMRAIGAKLITSRTGTQTAEAARIDASSETSVLSDIAGNASEAITDALKFTCDFMGGNPDEVKYVLNKSFFDESMTAQDVMALISLEDRGDISKPDTRHRLRNAGWLRADRTDDDIDGDVEDGGGV